MIPSPQDTSRDLVASNGFVVHFLWGTIRDSLFFCVTICVHIFTQITPYSWLQGWMFWCSKGTSMHACMLPEAPRSPQKLPDATRSSQMLPDAPRSSQMLPEAPRCSQKLPEAPRSSQMLPDAPRCSQKLTVPRSFRKLPHWSTRTQACVGANMQIHTLTCTYSCRLTQEHSWELF